MRSRMAVVTVTLMKTSSFLLRRDFRFSALPSSVSTCNSLLQRYFAIFCYQAAARGFLVVLALSIHDLFEGFSKISNFSSHCLTERVGVRRGSGSGQTPVLRWVPPPRLRLSQVGHLRLSGTEVGQVCGKSAARRKSAS